MRKHLPQIRIVLASRVYSFGSLRSVRAGCSFPALWPVLRSSSHERLRSLLEGAWGSGPHPSQLGIFLSAFQKHDSHIWMTAAWDRASLVQSHSALRVESRARSSCWEEPGDIFRENKAGLETTVDFSTSLDRRTGRRPARLAVPAGHGLGPGRSPPGLSVTCVCPAVYSPLPLSSGPAPTAPTRQAPPSTPCPLLLGVQLPLI